MNKKTKQIEKKRMNLDREIRKLSREGTELWEDRGNIEWRLGREETGTRRKEGLVGMEETGQRRKEGLVGKEETGKGGKRRSGKKLRKQEKEKRRSGRNGGNSKVKKRRFGREDGNKIKGMEPEVWYTGGNRKM